MIVIINPPFMNKNSAYYQLYKYYKKYPSPALAIFAGLFHKQGIPYLCIDAKLDDLTYDDILNRIEEKFGKNSPTVLGVSNANTTLIDDDLDMVRFLKKKFPKVPIVIGGPHVSALPKQTLESCKELDVVCKFEGTETLLDLYDFYATKSRIKSLEEIEGIVYRKESNGSIQINPNRSKRKVDTLNLGRPRWEDFSKADMYHVFTATGCPYLCSYCFNMTNRRFSLKPVDYVIEELQVLINKNGMTHFMFADGTFGVHRNNTQELLQRMIDEGIAEKVSWNCTSRVDILDREFVSLMKRAGCWEIALGLESGSDKVLRRAHKKTNTEQIKKCVEIVKSVGIHCKTFIIFGHIGETIEDIKQTINLTVSLNPDEVVVGVMTPWPGTEVFDLALKKEEGLELATKEYKKFDKYFGESLINKNITLDALNSLRNEMYLRLYLQNGRYGDFLQFVWKMKRPIARKLLSLVKYKLFSRAT